MSKISMPTLLTGLLFVVILVAAGTTFQVGFNEVAIRVLLGRADETSVVREPGLKFKWIPPIETVQKYDTRLRTLDTFETEFKTSDGKNVIIGAYAIWTIEDPLKFYVKVRSEGAAEQQMRSRLQGAKNAVVGQSTLADFVNRDAETKDASYNRMLQEIADTVRPGLLTDYGIQVRQVGFRRIALPAETTQQVFQSMIAERNRLASAALTEGTSRAATIRQQAEADARSIRAFAEAMAEEIRAAGTQAATMIYQQVAPEDQPLLVYLRWLEGLRAIFAPGGTVVIDQQSPLFAPFVNPPIVRDADGQARIRLPISTLPNLGDAPALRPAAEDAVLQSGGVSNEDDVQRGARAAGE